MKFLINSVCLLLIASSLIAQNKIESVDGSTVKTERLDKKIEFLMDSANIPGLSLAIINQNEIVYHKVFGVQNIDSREPLNKENIFEGASLSKPIFAYFAMKMVEKGILDLDKPLYEYLPHPAIDSAYQDWYKIITPRMVLSHSTGFPNHSNGEQIRLSFKPGTEKQVNISISNTGATNTYLLTVTDTEDFFVDVQPDL